MANFLGGIVSLVLSIVLIATVVMTTIKNTSTTGWTTAETSAFGLISLVVIFGLVYSAGALFGMF